MRTAKALVSVAYAGLISSSPRRDPGLREDAPRSALGVVGARRGSAAVSGKDDESPTRRARATTPRRRRRHVQAGRDGEDDLLPGGEQRAVGLWQGPELARLRQEGRQLPAVPERREVRGPAGRSGLHAERRSPKRWRSGTGAASPSSSTSPRRPPRAARAPRSSWSSSPTTSAHTASGSSRCCARSSMSSRATSACTSSTTRCRSTPTPAWRPRRPWRPRSRASSGNTRTNSGRTRTV